MSHVAQGISPARPSTAMPAMGMSSTIPGKAYLDKDQAITLIRRLAQDEAFYARFQASPAAGLAELHLPQQFALCCQGITLPSMEVLRRSEAALARDISAFTSQTVIGLAVK